ncbi:MAG TPA: antibiotic biosynthesis monooxygenase [Terriglobales bacterium]|nr:antibiotic biosynthesis monooxygenase [Terriglobales bacterium]
MFARIVELFPRLERKDEFLRTVRTDVMPILKKQPGFLEMLPFIPEVENERIVVISLWAEKRDADRYVREVFPRISDIVKPYLLSPIASRHYTVESSLCPHFLETLAA